MACENWLANRISKVGRFRRAVAACVNAVGPAGSQARGRMEMRRQNGTQRDSAGLSGTGFPGLGALTWATRNSRTRADRMRVSRGGEWRNPRGERLFRWVGMGVL
jgi:hypothetical protein